VCSPHTTTPTNHQGLRREEFQRLLANLAASPFKVEMVLRLLGLTAARGTIVGNALVRGISGGERKRVTTGERLGGGYLASVAGVTQVTCRHPCHDGAGKDGLGAA
jgi:hypothetical protein